MFPWACSYYNGVPMEISYNDTYAILQMNLDPIDITEVGRVLSAVRGIPLADGTRLARHAYGVVDEAVPLDEAEQIKERLEQMGVPVFLVQMSQFHPYPVPVTTRNADCLDSGFNVELPYGPQETVQYEDVILVSGGRLQWEETVTVVESADSMGIFSRSQSFGFRMDGQYGERSTVHRKRKKTRIDQFLFRILCRNPVRSFQISKDEFNYDYLGARKAMDTVSNLRLFLKDLVDRSPHVLLGQSVAAFLETDLRNVMKFSSMADFEEYNQWLFHWCYHVQDQNETR